MKRFFSGLSKKAVLSLALAVGILGIAIGALAWSPERPTYTMAQPADHVTFNSITDNPREGDERAFFELKDAANTASDGFAHQMTVKDGQEVMLRMYVHNNAADNLNGTKLDGVGVAKNTKVRVWLPSVTDSVMRANAYVSADNAQPQTVADTVDFVAPTTANKFSIEYVPGSAVAYNNFAGTAGLKLSDSIVTSGALLGEATADGIMPGCFKYANVVTLKVKVTMQATATPTFTLNKSVAVPGSGSWAKSVSVAPGATVAYQLEFKNTGTSTLSDVVLRDQLPTNVAIVPGSVKLFNGSNASGLTLSDAVVSNGGQNIGAYTTGANAYVQFKATMPAADKLQCGANKVQNIGQALASGADFTDTADATVTKTCDTTPTPTPMPTYSCEDLVVTPGQNRTATATVKYNAKDGATYKNTTLTWGDSKQDVITGTTATHTYATDGSYTVTANMLFTVNGSDKAPTVNQACTKVVAITTTPTPTPTKVPNVQIEKLVEGVKTKEVEIAKSYTYTVKVTNNGEVDLKDVVVSDAPESGSNIQIVSVDGAKLITGNSWSTVVPSLKVGESKSYTLTAQVTQYTAGSLVNTACVNAVEVNPSKPSENDFCDKATVTVKQPTKPTPVYSCDLVTLTAASGRKVTAKVDYTAKDGAKFKMATYTWGDNGTPLVTDKTSADYQYAKDGTYSVSVRLLFNVDGTNTYAADTANCVKTVIFTTPAAATPATPATPSKALPNTGAGSVVGIFGVVTLLGTIGYRLLLGRKIVRQ